MIKIQTTKMVRVSPTDKLPKSLIEQAANKTKSDTLWAKIGGYLCLPCCCLGLVCLGMSEEYNGESLLYSRLVVFYGGEVLTRTIAQKVRAEMALFSQAVIAINKTCDPLKIENNLTLIELVKEFNPKFKTLTKSSYSSLFDALENLEYRKDKIYKQLVWDYYIAIGGNMNTVVYGFIECMIIKSGPSNAIVKQHIKLLLSTDGLRAEVEEAGKLV